MRVLDPGPAFFGRRKDVEVLIARATEPGLTMVLGRPRMGKTTLLLETARRLSEEHGCLVGYHEWVGSSDMLRGAAEDLYERWLSQETLRSQARRFADKVRGLTVGDTAKAIGVLLTDVAGVATGAPPVVTNRIKETFNGLATLNRNLSSGATGFPAISYEQSRDLVKLASQYSGDTPVVLILDAWEQSEGVETDRKLFENFLSRIDEWPPCHLLLGVRQPDAGDEDKVRRIQRITEALDRASLYADRYEVPPLDLSLPSERDAALEHVRELVHAARGVEDEALVGLINGYSGVIEQWTARPVRERIDGLPDLTSYAEDAQASRYRELDWLIRDVSPPRQRVVFRLAMLPPLDADTWRELSPLVLEGSDEAALQEFRRTGLLKDSAIPSFGTTLPAAGSSTRKAFECSRKKRPRRSSPRSRAASNASTTRFVYWC